MHATQSEYLMMTSSNKNFFALLALCEGNSPVTGEFPSQRPMTRNFDVFFDLHLNKRLSKQSRRRWFETLSRSLWRQCNVFWIFCRRFPVFCTSKIRWMLVCSKGISSCSLADVLEGSRHDYCFYIDWLNYNNSCVVYTIHPPSLNRKSGIDLEMIIWLLRIKYTE